MDARGSLGTSCSAALAEPPNPCGAAGPKPSGAPPGAPRPSGLDRGAGLRLGRILKGLVQPMVYLAAAIPDVRRDPRFVVLAPTGEKPCVPPIQAALDADAMVNGQPRRGGFPQPVCRAVPDPRCAGCISKPTLNSHTINISGSSRCRTAISRKSPRVAKQRSSAPAAILCLLHPGLGRPRCRLAHRRHGRR